MENMHDRDCAPRRVTGKNLRAFTAVELVVSVGIFLAVATFITLTIAQSLGGSAQAERARASSAVSADLLNTLSSYSYDTLLSNSFTVPSPCSADASGTGLAGTSCVSRPGGDLVVKYYYADAQGQCPDLITNPQATGAATADELASVSSKVVICAIALGPDGQPNTDSVMQSVAVNAPWSGYEADKSRVQVRVDTQDGTFPSALYLVSAQNPTLLVAGPAPVQDEVASFLLNPATQCTDTSPCMVALAASTTPTLAAGKALFGEPASPQADIRAQAGSSVSASVLYTQPSQVEVTVSAPGQSAPPQDETVCLSAQRRADPASSLLECNTGSSVVFDSYSAGAATYPLPPGESVLVTLDPASGACPAQGRTKSSSGTWSTAPVCTSWTWGTTTSLPISVVTPSQVAVEFDSYSPAAGLEVSGPWTLPRLTPACATTATCSPVATVPEATWCPGQACLSEAP